MPLTTLSEQGIERLSSKSVFLWVGKRFDVEFFSSPCSLLVLFVSDVRYCYSSVGIAVKNN